MLMQNADSSPTGRRELHEGERMGKDLAEQQVAVANERAYTLRLGRELDTARTEIAHLRGELEKAYLAQTATPTPPARHGVRTLAWLGITAGVTMLVGAGALAAAMRPSDRSVAMAESPIAAAACPRVELAAPTASESKPATSVEPAPPKVAPKPRPAATKGAHGGKGKPTVTSGCDPMKDPLCGIDGSVSDEAAKPRGKKQR